MACFAPDACERLRARPSGVHSVGRYQIVYPAFQLVDLVGDLVDDPALASGAAGAAQIRVGQSDVDAERGAAPSAIDEAQRRMIERILLGVDHAVGDDQEVSVRPALADLLIVTD